MFEKTFKKLGEAFDAITEDMNTITAEYFKDTKIHTADTCTITEQNGHINITGRFKSLHINGRLVRFK